MSVVPILFIVAFICVKHKVKIVHSYHRYFDVIAFIISKLLGIRAVTSVQSKVFNRKRISYLSHNIIACSEAIKSHLINYFKVNENRITRIYNFVNIEEVHSVADKKLLRYELNIPQNSFLIGYFGRLSVKEKGLDILLDAYKNVCSKNNTVLLMIVGEGEDNELLIKKSEEMNCNIDFIKPNSDIYKYFNIIDLFILPSRVEPFGIVLIEAGIMRIPVIAGNVDGIPEIVENNVTGLLFEKDNYFELTKSIEELISNETKRIFLANNLYNKTIKNFSNRIIIPQYAEYYNKLLKI